MDQSDGPSERDRASALERAKAGAFGAGLIFAPFALPIPIGLILGGPEHVSRGSVIRVDLLLLVYPLGAILAGAVLGLFGPFVGRSRWRSALAGVVAVPPWFAGIASTLDHGYTAWNTGHTFVTIMMTGIFGPLVGQWARHE